MYVISLLERTTELWFFEEFAELNGYLTVLDDP